MYILNNLRGLDLHRLWLVKDFNHWVPWLQLSPFLLQVWFVSMEEPSPSFNMHRTSMKAAGKGLEVCLTKKHSEIKIGNIMEVNKKGVFPR